MSESFWVKLTYKEFIGHYCEMTDAEIVADVRKSIGSFSNDRADGDDFGAKMVKKANARMNGEAAGASRSNGQKGGRPKNITAAAATREGVDESATGCNQLTADGDIREDSLNIHDTGDHGTLESGTSANHYDQEASPAGAGVNLNSTHTISPDAFSGNAEGVITNGSPITRNGSRVVCTSAPSGQTITTAETLDKAGEGGVSPEVGCQASSLPSPISKPKTDPKPLKKKAEQEGEPKFPHGEFENIMLTTKEYIQLCERLDNADSLIDEADQYFEAQPDKKKKYKSHYAMLLNWDRRRKEVETPSRVRRFKTAVDQDREEIQKIADYYAAKNRGEHPPMPKLKMVEAV